MRVLRDDNTEVEIGENIDYSDTDLRSIIEGDRSYNQEESFGAYGYQQQEFADGELVDVDGQDEEDDDSDFDDYEDDSDFDDPSDDMLD